MPRIAARLLPLIDLTSLNDAHDDDIAGLCAKAVTPHGPVAAVCSWPEFAAEMKTRIAGQGLRVAAVVDFPGGTSGALGAAAEARKAAASGADELDLVMPFRAWLGGDQEAAVQVMQAVREAAPQATLKVILETSVLETPDIIAAASRAAIAAGADFLKTSTGKLAVGATPQAAEAMLRVIRETGGKVGFKASGGIRSLEDAAVYLDLAERIVGAGYVCAKRFRIGASKLLDSILDALDTPISPRARS